MKSEFSKDAIIKKKKNAEGETAPKEWIPDLEFEKSDFPAAGNIPKKSASPGSSQTANPVNRNNLPGKSLKQPEPVAKKNSVNVTGWKPPVLSARGTEGLPDKNSVKKNILSEEKNIHTSPDHSGKTDPVPRDHKVHSPAQSRETSDREKGVDASLAYFQSMITNFPENTVHLLRNWYFKKYISGGAGIEGIHPHDRIFIVLVSAGQNITQGLFGIMSPVERQNFMEILKRKNTFNAYQIHTVRNEFMNSVRDFV